MVACQKFLLNAIASMGAARIDRGANVFQIISLLLIFYEKYFYANKK